MSEALVSIKNLKKYFPTRGGTLHAVDDISLDIPRGKTLGVVGESGCGKSTLGRTIIHLLESTSGSIFTAAPTGTASTTRSLRRTHSANGTTLSTSPILHAAAALTGSDSTPSTSEANPLRLRSIAIDPPISPRPTIPTVILSCSISVRINSQNLTRPSNLPYAFSSTCGLAQREILT